MSIYDLPRPILDLLGQIYTETLNAEMRASTVVLRTVVTPILRATGVI